MPQRMTIADARNHLPQVIHQVERGEPVELTRRGKPVAVILSLDDFERSTYRKKGFLQALEEWREKYDIDRNGLEPEEWLPPRDPSPGREVEL